MAFIPLRQSLEFMVPGKAVDRFGNERPTGGDWVKRPVASWWVDMSQEEHGDSILRTVDTLHVHLPVENAPPSWGRIRTPDGSVWEVEGNVEDFTHGWHGWNPGLVVVHAKRVSG